MLDEMDDEADFDLDFDSFLALHRPAPPIQAPTALVDPSILTSIGNAAERLARRREELKRQELDSLRAAAEEKRRVAQGRRERNAATVAVEALPPKSVDEPPLPSKSSHQELLGWSDLPALPPLPDLTPQVWPELAVVPTSARIGSASTSTTMAAPPPPPGAPGVGAAAPGPAPARASPSEAAEVITSVQPQPAHETTQELPQAPQPTMLPPPPQQPSLEASPADPDVAAAPPPTQPVVESPASARVAALQRGWRARRALRSTRGAELVQQLRDARQMRADLSASGEVLSGYDEVMLRGLATQVAKQVESLGLFCRRPLPVRAAAPKKAAAAHANAKHASAATAAETAPPAARGAAKGTARRQLPPPPSAATSDGTIREGGATSSEARGLGRPAAEGGAGGGRAESSHGGRRKPASSVTFAAWSEASSREAAPAPPVRAATRTADTPLPPPPPQSAMVSDAAPALAAAAVPNAGAEADSKAARRPFLRRKSFNLQPKAVDWKEVKAKVDSAPAVVTMGARGGAQTARARSGATAAAAPSAAARRPHSARGAAPSYSDLLRSQMGGAARQPPSDRPPMAKADAHQRIVERNRRATKPAASAPRANMQGQRAPAPAAAVAARGVAARSAGRALPLSLGRHGATVQEAAPALLPHTTTSLVPAPAADGSRLQSRSLMEWRPPVPSCSLSAWSSMTVGRGFGGYDECDGYERDHATAAAAEADQALAEAESDENVEEVVEFERDLALIRNAEAALLDAHHAGLGHGHRLGLGRSQGVPPPHASTETIAPETDDEEDDYEGEGGGAPPVPDAALGEPPAPGRHEETDGAEAGGAAGHDRNGADGDEYAMSPAAMPPSAPVVTVDLFEGAEVEEALIGEVDTPSVCAPSPRSALATRSSGLANAPACQPAGGDGIGAKLVVPGVPAVIPAWEAQLKLAELRAIGEHGAPPSSFQRAVVERSGGERVTIMSRMEYSPGEPLAGHDARTKALPLPPARMTPAADGSQQGDASMSTLAASAADWPESVAADAPSFASPADGACAKGGLADLLAAAELDADTPLPIPLKGVAQRLGIERERGVVA